MFKVILISDNKHTREEFEDSKLFNELSFKIEQVIGTNDNIVGIIDSMMPDVIICPSSSRFSRGSEIADHIISNKLPIKTVFYGRKSYEHIYFALSAKASGYISFPVDQNEFAQTFSMLKKELEQEQLSSFSFTENKNNLSELREEFFIKLLKGTFTNEQQITASFCELDFNMKYNQAYCALIHLKIQDLDNHLSSKWKYGKESLYTAINNFFSVNNKFLITSIISRNNDDLLAFAIAPNKLSINQIISMLEQHNFQATENMHELLKLHVKIDIIKIYDSLLDIQKDTNLETSSSISTLLNIIKNPPEVTDDEVGVIARSKEYINNCFNKDICLNDVAEFVFLSPAYFSRLFKQETGENFIDYLIKVRMENAKKYLHSTIYKTYEISQMVGYKKSKYFSKLFRKYTGFTPTEYRTMITHEKQKRELSQI